MAVSCYESKLVDLQDKIWNSIYKRILHTVSCTFSLLDNGSTCNGQGAAEGLFIPFQAWHQFSLWWFVALQLKFVRVLSHGWLLCNDHMMDDGAGMLLLSCVCSWITSNKFVHWFCPLDCNRLAILCTLQRKNVVMVYDRSMDLWYVVPPKNLAYIYPIQTHFHIKEWMLLPRIFLALFSFNLAICQFPATS